MTATNAPEQPHDDSQVAIAVDPGESFLLLDCAV